MALLDQISGPDQPVETPADGLETSTGVEVLHDEVDGAAAADGLEVEEGGETGEGGAGGESACFVSVFPKIQKKRISGAVSIRALVQVKIHDVRCGARVQRG